MTHHIVNITAAIARTASQGIRIQLLLMLCCLPITTFWGLAIPYLSPVGNLIFVPFLTVFILLGLLLLIGYFAGLPLSLPAYLLDQLTHIWLQLLQLAPPHLSLALPIIFFPLSLCGPALAFYLLYNRNNHYSFVRDIIAISTFFAVIIGSNYVYRMCTINFAHIRRAKVGATIIACNNRTVVVDWGGINAISGGLSWVQYQLTPDFYLCTGSTVIDYLVMVHPLKRVRGTLYAFARRVAIKAIIVPDQQSVTLLHTHPLPGTPTVISVQASPQTITLGTISLQLIYTNDSANARRMDLLLRQETKHVNLYDVWRHNYTQLAGMIS